MGTEATLYSAVEKYQFCNYPKRTFLLQVHTAKAVYCQLGDTSIGLVRLIALSASDNPSGKLVRDLRKRRRKLHLIKVREFAMRGDDCNDCSALCQGSFLLRMTQNTAKGGMQIIKRSRVCACTSERAQIAPRAFRQDGTQHAVPPLRGGRARSKHKKRDRHPLRGAYLYG